MIRKRKGKALNSFDPKTRQVNLPFENPREYRIVRRGGSYRDKSHIIFPLPEHDVRHFSSFKDCVETAVRMGVSLMGANLNDPFDGYNRQKHGCVDLSYGDYSHGDFRECFGEDINWKNSDISYCRFSASHTRTQVFRSGFELSTTELSGSDFSGCNGDHSVWDKAYIQGCRYGRSFDKMPWDEKGRAFLQDSSFKEVEGSITMDAITHGMDLHRAKIDGSVLIKFDLRTVKNLPPNAHIVLQDPLTHKGVYPKKATIKLTKPVRRPPFATRPSVS